MTPNRRQSLAAIACVACWLGATTLARSVGLWVSTGGVAIALGFAVFFFDQPTRRRLLRVDPLRAMAGVLVGAVMAAATYVVYPLAATVAPSLAADTRHLYELFRGPPGWVSAAMLGPIIVGEELVWRGMVQGALVRRLGPWGAACLGAVIYALAHAPLGSPVLILTALVCGLVWGSLRAATGSLVPPVLSHLLWDATVLIALPLLPR